MRERFDILWSRVFMMGSGRVGEPAAELRRGARLDRGHRATTSRQIDPAGPPIDSRDTATLRRSIDGRARRPSSSELRLYTLRVVRADTAAGAQVRDRIQSSAQTTAVISLAAVLVSVLSLFLILRENRRQRELAEMSRRSAEQAELASRAKSRFLSMMSHELRNPLNGVLGPLALLGQSDLAERQQRLVEQAQAVGAVDAADARGPARLRRDAGRQAQLRSEPFRVAALADAIRDALRGEGADARDGRASLPGTPERVHGDLDRLRQVFVHSRDYVLEGRGPTTVDGAASATTARTSSARSRFRRRGDGRLEARPADGPERDRPRPGHRRGAAAADRPRPDLGGAAAC